MSVAPMRVVFLGSGAFGLPTLRAVAERHDVVLVVTQPDRPAGRGRRPTPTPVADFAAGRSIPVIRPERVNEGEVVRSIQAARADVLLVVAFGQKIGPAILEGAFAINLHGSLLPKYRGAAPINRAMIAGETMTGVSVITVAARMDAGDVLAQAATEIDAAETAGELHDRLAALGSGLVLDVLARRRAGTLVASPQDESRATQAPKLRKSEGTVSFDQPAEHVRARIHGLTPWPGCTVALDGRALRLCRVECVRTAESGAAAPRGAVTPGALGADGVVACAPGAVRLLEVQSPGARTMSFAEWRRGHDVPAGARLAEWREKEAAAP
jgi:methionyl-tRNA formyltransferase